MATDLHDNWGPPVSAFGGRETPGNLPPRPEPTISPDETSAVEPVGEETADHAVNDEALGDLDAEQIATCRAMLAGGHFAAEEVQRMQNLTDAELAALQGTLPRKVWAIDKELAEIQAVMRLDRRRYERELAGRYRDLLAEKERLEQAPTDGKGLPKEVLDDWARSGGVEHHLKTAQGTARIAFEALEEQELGEFIHGFDALPASVQSAVYRHIGTEQGFAKPATDAAISDFAGLGDECADLVKSWGGHASRRLGSAKARVETILKGLPASERQAALEWMDALPPSQKAAVIRGLAGGGR